MADWSDESDTEGTARKEVHENEVDQIRTAASFFGFGVLLHLLFTLVISGSQDILAGTFIPTSTILVSHVGPMVVIATFLPWCMKKISYLIRTLAVFVFMVAGLFSVIFVDNVYCKIAGVSLNAIAHSLGEISFLALAAFYGKTAVTAFAAGSGAGILLGPIYYTGMTTWACVTPQRTLLIVSPSPLIVLLCYYSLNKDRVKQSHTFPNTEADDRQGEYAPLEAEDHALLSWREKLTAALKITPLMLSLMVTYVTQYITVQAVFTTLAFSNAPFAPRDHYVYYVLMNGLGEFITRSYLNIILFIKPTIVSGLIVKRTWLFAIPLLGIMVFAIFASYFRFLADVAVVMVTCLLTGALSGAVFANTVCAVSLIVEPRYREFCLGLISLGESAGALLASLAGLKVEPALREHCERITSGDVCFTRESRAAWSRAVCST